MKLILAISLAFAAQKTFLEDLFTNRLVAVEYTKPTLLTFIQPNCGPCKMQIEALKCVHEKKGKAVEILLVQSSGDPQVLQNALRREHLPFKALKGSPKFLAAFGADTSGTPLTALVDAKGKVLQRILGAQPCDYWQETLKQVAIP